MLNPINHARTRADVHRYKVEPYVVCADIYSMPPACRARRLDMVHGIGRMAATRGRGKRAGLRIEGVTLRVDPCIPKGWDHFEATLAYRSATYALRVDNPAGVNRGIVFAKIDGVEVTDRPVRVPLMDDGKRHEVSVRLE